MKSVWWIKKPLAISMIIMLLLGNIGCSAHEDKESLYVSAASSLAEPLQEIVAAYQASHKTGQVYLNLAGTSTLKHQILQGAKADLFLSASTTHYEELVTKGYIVQGEVLGCNEVILIAPWANQKVQTLQDLAKQDIRLLLTEPEVPIGSYSEAILALAESQYGEGFKQKALEQVVSRESNVKQVLTKIVMQEVDCGFVYQTDLTEAVEKKVRIIPIPESCKVQSTYWMGLTKIGNQKDSAHEFYGFMGSAMAQEIWEKYGWQSEGDKDVYSRDTYSK